MMDGVDTLPPPVDVEPPPTGREPGWVRPVIVVVAVLAMLLFGAAGGFLLGRTGAPAAVPAAGSVDVGFSQDMSVHHQQAVEMAAWERDHTTDPLLRQISYDIESTQTAQIGRMQGWLELWGAASLPTGEHMTWMAMAPAHGHGGDHTGTGGVSTMPGMATSDDLRALRVATGPQLDVLFLQLMVRHHEGGAEMLRYAAQHAGEPAVRNLATQILSSQSAESQYLRELLAQRGGTPLPLG